MILLKNYGQHQDGTGTGYNDIKVNASMPIKDHWGDTEDHNDHNIPV